MSDLTITFSRSEVVALLDAAKLSTGQPRHQQALLRANAKLRDAAVTATIGKQRTRTTHE